MAHEIARVARRLEETKETKHLDLSKCELNQVPDATYLMLKETAVETCDLSGNTIKRIQSKFCTKLPSLTEIHVQENRLAALPDEFKNLEELKVLDISNNNFEVFPSCIYDCPKLTTVLAKGNHITDVDVDRLRAMESLRDLDLQDNPLSSAVKTRLSDIDMFTVHIGESDPIGKDLEELE